jgi:sulfite exporter TauE/SafE
LTAWNLIPVFMIGLLGGVHCIGMCGGIVSAFSMAPGARRVIPVAAMRRARTSAAIRDDTLRVVAYNVGRVSSYAVAGGLAGSVRTLSSVSSIQVGGYVLANLMLVALGLYLMDAWRGLTRLEAAGQVVWRRVQPMMKHLLPVDTHGKAVALGALWGWVPCGMVYSVLLTAMFSGSAMSGAAVMLAFGLGTMPALLAMGMLGTRLQAWTRQRRVRVASGLIVLGFGVLGLLRAAGGLSPGWLDALCVTPQAHISTEDVR